MIIRGDEPEQIRLIKKLYKPGNYFMQGNEAVAYGAIFAGCRFYAGYPITPLKRNSRDDGEGASKARWLLSPDGG